MPQDELPVLTRRTVKHIIQGLQVFQYRRVGTAMIRDLQRPLHNRKVLIGGDFTRNFQTGFGIIRTEDSSGFRSEEHTSELQSLTNLVCRLLLENKNTQ